MVNMFSDKSGKTKLIWILLSVIALTTIVLVQVISAATISSVANVDVSSATDTGLDATKGVALDWIDSESSLTRRCLLLDIDAALSPQDIQLYTSETDFDASSLTNPSLEKSVTENYDEPVYETQCTETVQGNGSILLSDCSVVQVNTISKSRTVWQSVSSAGSDKNSDATLEDYSVSTNGDYRYCFDVPIVKNADGTFGNKGTVYARVNNQWFVDKQHSSWWNTTYNNRQAIYANASQASSPFDIVLYINGSNNGKLFGQTCWVNGTVTTTDSIVGYMYFNTSESATDFTIVDSTDSAQVPFVCEESGSSSASNYSASSVFDSNFTYLFEQGAASTLYDITGSYYVRKTGNPTSVAGLFGQAIEFDGVGNDDSYNTTTYKCPGPNGFTASAWAKVGDTSGNDVIFSCLKNGGGDEGLTLSKLGSNYYCQYRNSGGTQSNPNSPVPDTTDYHHIACTYTGGSGGNLTLYIDGVPKDSATVSGTGGQPDPGFSIGAVQPSKVYEWNGSIEMVQLYDSNLGDDWVMRDYGYERSRLGGVETNETADESLEVGAILTGIQNVIPSATIYDGQQVYVRYLNGSQMLGTFDKVAVYKNQRWAFNYVDTEQTYTNLQDLAPTLYVWENDSLNTAEITSQVQTLIQSTLA